MDGQTFLIAALGIVMGATVLIVGITKITGLIQTWIGRNKGYSEEEFERLAHAFTEYRKSTERRIRNLEAIAASDNEHWKPELSHGAIEIDERSKEEEPEQESGHLRNMLKS